MKTLKLEIELVPGDLWHRSIYNILKNANQLPLWIDIKQQIFKKEGKKCWICGEEHRRLEAHEFWEYDDKEHIQKLISIHHLCDMCHKVKHTGYWLETKEGNEQLKSEGLTKKEVINHFCKVNCCTLKVFNKHKKEAFDLHLKRGVYIWKQDFWIYEDIVKPFIKKRKTSHVGIANSEEEYMAKMLAYFEKKHKKR